MTAVRSRGALLAGALLSAAPDLYAAGGCSPVAQVDAYGGALSFQGQGTSAAGTASWLASCGWKAGDRDLLVPTYSGQYVKLRQVRELAAGGSLTSASLDDTAALRWIHDLDQSWSIKPNASYKNELISSPGESLDRGVFDYHKWSAGVEAERQGDRLASWRQGLSAYRVDYYHYRVAASPPSLLELQSSDRVLDFQAFDYETALDARAWSGGTLTGSWRGSYRRFAGEPVVDATARFESATRRDLVGLWLVGVKQVLPRAGLMAPSASSTFAYTLVDSSQNDYDPTRTRFNPGYYAYTEWAATHSVSAAWGRRLQTGLSYSLSHRRYRARPTQASDGSYTGGVVAWNAQALSFDASYALARAWAVKAQAAYHDVSSNTRFEQAYRYNYVYRYLFVGLGWSY